MPHGLSVGGIVTTMAFRNAVACIASTSAGESRNQLIQLPSVASSPGNFGMIVPRDPWPLSQRKISASPEQTLPKSAAPYALRSAPFSIMPALFQLKPRVQPSDPNHAKLA